MPSSFCICAPVANLYSKPDDCVEVISQALYGWEVLVLENQSSFIYIQTQDGYRGWTRSKDTCQFVSSNPMGQKVKLIHNAVPIYETPHVDRRKPILVLPFEVELKILSEPEEEQYRWIEIELIGGGSGWVQRGHVQYNPSRLTVQEMLMLTGQFKGIPYIWGGVSSFGYDCSGFIQMLWRQTGTLLPRDAYQQYGHTACFDVESEQLEPGDLLFFGSNPDQIRHVGLFIGSNTLVHASVKPIPIVQATTLDDPSLQRFNFRTFRRLLLKE